MRRAALLLLLAGLAAPAAAQSSSDCVPFAQKGCYYPGDGPLLVYLRGHLDGSGHISGAAKILASSRQAFDFYELGKTAKAKGAALLVTGSSDIPVLRKDLEALEKQAGRKFDKVAVAAHSGAYISLPATLDSLERVDRVLLLDCFYGSSNLTELASKVARLEQAGAACAGYLTPHNRKRFETYFGDKNCPVEKRPSDQEHNGRVNACLGAYLDGTACTAIPRLDLKPLDELLETLAERSRRLAVR